MGGTPGPREVVERLVATINAHDPAAGRALFRHDARLVAATGRVLTLAGLARMLSDSVAAFPDLTVRVERWVVDGDTVVTEELMEGTHGGEFAGLAPTGRPVRLPMCHLARVAGGLIVERIAYHDTAGILRQLT
ncbi:MAG TPA: ester cyclase [Acidimicrobiales bacterium]|nr:ester cyclase [Acidimicrobiales bacterium]